MTKVMTHAMNTAATPYNVALLLVIHSVLPCSIAAGIQPAGVASAMEQSEISATQTAILFTPSAEEKV